MKNRTGSDLHVLFDHYTKIVESRARELNPWFAGEVEELPLCIQRIARLKTEGDQLQRQLNEILDKSFFISWID